MLLCPSEVCFHKVTRFLILAYTVRDRDLMTLISEHCQKYRSLVLGNPGFDSGNIKASWDRSQEVG